MAPPKQEKIYAQAGAIPYRRLGGELQILLITTRKKRRWIVPKGLIDPGFAPRDAASKEAWEEAGIAGVLAPTSCGAYEYKKWGGLCRVELFPLEVREEARDWPECDERARVWVAATEAERKVHQPGLAAVIGAFRRKMECASRRDVR